MLLLSLTSSQYSALYMRLTNPRAQANFVLLWLCMAFLMLRGNRVRTYHWVGLVELVIMGLWIPPMYAVSRDLERHPDGTVFESSVAALTFFALNM